MNLLDGKLISEQLIQQLSEEVSKITEQGKRKPHLAAILVGDDPASQTYVGAKVKACDTIGFASTLIRLDKDSTQEQLMQYVTQFNNDPQVDGILVQLPLPKHLDENEVIYGINPDKDVDGFHPISLGKMTLGQDTFVSATPQGIMLLLEKYNINTSGKHCVVIGRSNIVGTPMSILMSRNTNPGNCTVTVCHSRTENLEDICRQADIIIAAIGRPFFVKENMVKEGAIVIDVGINKIEDASKKSGFRLVGDVDFDGVKDKCSYITPVPGGVGKMTIAALMYNTLKAYKIREAGQ